LLQLLYAQLARSRRRYYQRRPDLRRRLARPVVSVGNLTVGGSGKTPIAGEIAQLLLASGERPSILSRGYARTSPGDGVAIVSDGARIRVDVARAGDEPFMLANALPGCAVVVCGDRYLAGRVAEAELSCTVHVLDDGFQHLTLMRDLDLLVVPSEDLSDTRTLPFGRFREPLDAAASADAVLVPVGGPLSADEVRDRLKVSAAFVFDRRVRQPDHAMPVFAFAGIAKPERFFSDLERSGWPLVGRRSFADHHWYTADEIAAIRRAAREAGAGRIVTTAKDFVRLQSLLPVVGQTIDPEIVAIPLEVSIESAFGLWLRERLAGLRAA
jgi:tetraacyldisaccharide 4'-kinase